MVKLLFPATEAPARPATEAPPRDVYTNLNGDGGRSGSITVFLVLTLLSGVFFAVAYFWSDPEPFWVGVVCVVSALFSLWQYFNAAVVESSHDSLRLRRRGKTYVIPLVDIERVREPRGIWLFLCYDVWANGGRDVTIYLKKKYPFGSSFRFRTKREFMAPDPNANLIRERVAQARGRVDGQRDRAQI